MALTTCRLRVNLTTPAENAGKGLYTKNRDVLIVPELYVPGQLLFFRKPRFSGLSPRHTDTTRLPINRPAQVSFREID
jgi:hypothetical protein